MSLLYIVFKINSFILKFSSPARHDGSQKLRHNKDGASRVTPTGLGDHVIRDTIMSTPLQWFMDKTNMTPGLHVAMPAGLGRSQADYVQDARAAWAREQAVKQKQAVIDKSNADKRTLQTKLNNGTATIEEIGQAQTQGLTIPSRFSNSQSTAAPAYESLTTDYYNSKATWHARRPGETVDYSDPMWYYRDPATRGSRNVARTLPGS